MSADQIVSNRSRSWNIIRGKEPNPDLASEICNGIPDVPDEDKITKGPLDKTIRWKIERNIQPIPLLYSSELPAVRIEIVLKYTYGARYKGGGAYIDACWFEVPTCFLQWGYEVWLGVDVDYVTNGGTPTAPIARMRLDVSGHMAAGHEWQLPLKRTFFVRGDGFVPTL